MKKVNLFYILLMSVLVLSCGEANDSQACLKSVQEAFPKGKVYAPAEGSVLTFIVIDSPNVYRVKTGSIADARVTEVTPLFIK